MQKTKSRQAKLLEEKDEEGSSDELISKDREILAAEEKLKRKRGAYSYLVKRIKAAEMFEEKERSHVEMAKRKVRLR